MSAVLTLQTKPRKLNFFSALDHITQLYVLKYILIKSFW